MVDLFTEANVTVPKNWRTIGLKLGLNLKGQLSATEFFRGWTENSIKKPSWKSLAHVLKDIEEYASAARIATEKARKNVN